MRKTLLTAVAGALLLATAPQAMELHLGYTNLAGKYHFNARDYTPVVDVNSPVDEDIAIGSLFVGAGSMTKVNDMFSIGFSLGASMPGDVTFNDADMVTPPAGVINWKTGDTVKFEFMQIPLLARAALNMAAGPGEASLGLGAGVVIISMSTETTDQQWSDGTAGGGEQADQDAAHTAAAGKEIFKTSGAVGLFAFEITPGYHYKLNDKSSIGIDIPLTITSDTEVTVDREDDPKQFASPVVNAANPDYTSGFLRNLDLGGFNWGVRLVYSVRI